MSGIGMTCSFEEKNRFWLAVSWFGGCSQICFSGWNCCLLGVCWVRLGFWCIAALRFGREICCWICACWSVSLWILLESADSACSIRRKLLTCMPLFHGNWKNRWPKTFQNWFEVELYQFVSLKLEAVLSGASESSRLTVCLVPVLGFIEVLIIDGLILALKVQTLCMT
jgi:hypothetical protein